MDLKKLIDSILESTPEARDACEELIKVISKVETKDTLDISEADIDKLMESEE